MTQQEQDKAKAAALAVGNVKRRRADPTLGEVDGEVRGAGPPIVELGGELFHLDGERIVPRPGDNPGGV